MLSFQILTVITKICHSKRYFLKKNKYLLVAYNYSRETDIGQWTDVNCEEAWIYQMLWVHWCNIVFRIYFLSPFNRLIMQNSVNCWENNGSVYIIPEKNSSAVDRDVHGSDRIGSDFGRIG